MPRAERRLETTAPNDTSPALSFLAARAVEHLESIEGTSYRRVLPLPGGLATVALELGDPAVAVSRPAVAASFDLARSCDLPVAIARCRHLLDLDRDPAVDAVLRRDPALRASVRAHPGIRVMGTLDPEESAFRAVVGQRISVAAARSCVARMVERLGQPLPPRRRAGRLTAAFPSSETLAEADLGGLGLTAARQQTIRELARRLAGGEIPLDGSVHGEEVVGRLQEIRGIGPWTAAYVALRGLGDADAFPATDLGIVRGARRLGLPDDPAALAEHAERWRPWRAYAAHHLWAAPPP